jgi:DNA-binding transcriptional MerR regulator
MNSTDLLFQEEHLKHPESETDRLSDFLRDYQNEKEWVSPEEKEYQEKLIQGIERLNQILEGIIIPDKNDSLRNWITTEQVMSQFEISERTLAYWRKSGKLPFSRIEHKFFYHTADLEKLFAIGYIKKVK